jgi:hypothetical protein
MRPCINFMKYDSELLFRVFEYLVRYIIFGQLDSSDSGDTSTYMETPAEAK